LSQPYIANKPTARVLASFSLLAASSAFHYWAISYATVRTGFFAYVMPNGRPMTLLIVAAVTLVLGVAVAPRGSRMWSCGMSLMTSAAAITAMLVTYVPFGTSLVRYMPRNYQPIDVPWQPMVAYAILITCIALVLLRITKRPRVDKAQWSIPDLR
jgi:hypothetical protein